MNSIVITLPQPYCPPVMQVKKRGLEDVQKMPHRHSVVTLQRQALKFGFWLPDTLRQDASVLEWPGSGCYFPSPTGCWQVSAWFRITQKKKKKKDFREVPGKARVGGVLCSYRLCSDTKGGGKGEKRCLCISVWSCTSLWTSDPLKDCLWTKDVQLFSELNTQHICFVKYKSVRPHS